MWGMTFTNLYCLIIPDTGSGETATESQGNTTAHTVYTDKNVSATNANTHTRSITNTPDIATTTTPSSTQSVYDDDNNATNKINETDYDWPPPPPIEFNQLEEEFYDIMCNTTCEQKCGDREPQGSAVCYCDWACIHLGDCCLDYEAACFSGPNVTVKNYADILRNRSSPSAICFTIPEVYQINSLLVVTYCEITFADAVDSLTIDLCERPQVENKTLATELPVVFRDVIYRNRYWAICNNPGEQLTDSLTAGANINCANTTQFAYWQRYDGDIGKDIDISNCDIQFNLSTFGNTSRYRCMMDSTAIDTCDASYAFAIFDFDYLQLTCQKYNAYISRSYSGTTSYSNPHCAMCNGDVDKIYDMACGAHAPGRDPPPSFDRIITFKEMEKWIIICTGESVLDHATGYCVTPTCPAGQVMLLEKGCTALVMHFPQIFSAKRDIRIFVVIVSKYQFHRDAYQKLVKDDIGVDIVDDSFRVSACDSFEIWDNWNEVMPINYTCWIQEALSRNYTKVVSRVELFAAQVRYQSKPFYNSVGITMFVFRQDATDISSVCLQGSAKIRHDIVLLGDRFSLETFPSTFLVRSTAQEYNVSEVPILVSWRDIHSTGIGWNEIITALVCEPDIMSCDTVTFQADEYIAMGESLVIYDGTPQEVNILERNVLRLDSNAIVFCSSLLANLTGVLYLYSNTTDSFIGGVLTAMGSTLSMVCLILTMTTYCLFEQIRTRAGKCVMNLCVSLFFAQLSFQVSDTLVSYHEACAALAAFQHYFWLVAFMWMNVLAFDISCAFADLKPSKVYHDSTRLHFFVMYAWGVPAVFVAVCLVLDLGTNLPFSYGNSTMCWIAGLRAVVYYFATPLAIVITANAVLFVRTVLGLRRALTIASKARQPLQQRKTFAIYVRLTSLMGFTWLFGFLSNIDVLGFLSYPFILCNTCQGVFIFVSFALTPTVRRHFRDWLKAKQNRDTSDNSIAKPITKSAFVNCESRL